MTVMLCAHIMPSDVSVLAQRTKLHSEHSKLWHPSYTTVSCCQLENPMILLQGINKSPRTLLRKTIGKPGLATSSHVWAQPIDTEIKKHLGLFKRSGMNSNLPHHCTLQLGQNTFLQRPLNFRTTIPLLNLHTTFIPWGFSYSRAGGWGVGESKG